MTYTFKVQDMTCGGCAASIRNAVGQIAGVEQVQADLDTKRVVVDATADVTADAIFAAINEAGYDEVSVLDAPAAQTVEVR